VSKEQILSEIRRCAAENDGAPLGKARFEAATEIRESDWSGRYWTRWGDAIAEAGFSPNTLNAALSTDKMLRQLADLTRQLGHFPTSMERRMQRTQDSHFPSHGVWNRLGSRPDLIARLAEFCANDPSYADVGLICAPLLESGDVDDEIEEEASTETAGSVYLIKSGKHFKIGRTNHVGRRRYEISLRLPEKEVLVHEIETDDPVGIESYWHQRFKDRNTNGEWFSLSKADVAAFKRRRRFM
jgi:hypothetical protein